MMPTVAVALLFAQAPDVAAGAKPWEPRSMHGAASRAIFELKFQVVRDQPPYRLAGLPRYDRAAMDDALLLGDVLFHAPKLLGPRAAWFGLSCNTCHPGGAAHNTLFVEAQSDRPGNVDLLSDYFYAEADDGVFAPRNISSLRGCATSGPYRRDGSAADLFEANAFVVRHEFQQKQVPELWLHALTGFVSRLELLPNAKVDAKGQLTAAAPELARAGEKVFDAAGCVACHVKATGFSDHARHPPHAPGKTGELDTPGLLGLAETAPYFFDGSAATLSAAAAQLSKTDRAALTAYLEAIGAVDEPRITWTPAERVRQALEWGRVAETADEPLWELVLDAMRLQVRLAGHTPQLQRLAAELATLRPNPAGRERIRALRTGGLGREAGRRD